MAGTVTITEKVFSSVKKITFDWTATAACGEATATTTKYYDGDVLRIVCMTGASCGYGITVSDSDGVDLLGSQGVAVPDTGYDFGTSTGSSFPGPRLSAVSGKISMEVTGSCGEGTGETVVYVR